MELKRLFNQPDVDMISQTRHIYSFFSKNLADYTAFDPRFNAAYVSAFAAAQETAGRLALGDNDEDETVADGLLIDESNRVLLLCRQKYADVLYFASKAFPNNKAILREFGQGVYSKVCASRLRMVQFMETLHGVANKYKTQLIAADFTQEAIDQIGSLATQLRSANQAQQLQKTQRPTETRKRIEALNTLYTMAKQVRNASRNVYRLKPEKYQSLLLGVRHHSRSTKAWITLAAGKTRKIAITKLLQKFNITLTNQGKETVEYYRANNLQEKPELHYLLASRETVNLQPLEPKNKFLVIKNKSTKPVRLMLAKERLHPV